MSEAIFHLNASVREDLGKGASRRLRREDKVPAVLYGGNESPLSLTLDHNKVLQAQEFETFYSQVITLNVDGKKVETIIKDMQRHPYKPKILHLDFQRVVAGEKLHTEIPVHFINEGTCPGVKTGGGVVEHHINTIDVLVEPKNLPEFITVDLATLQLGDTLHLSDVALPNGVESVELAKGPEHDVAVVTVNAPKGTAASDADSDNEEGGE